MSTLKKFTIKVGLVDHNGVITEEEDGVQLSADLIFENGNVVTELSQSMEPALLGGDAVLNKGEAAFELRITVLSKLCRGSKFRVQVMALDRPSYRVSTGPMKTVTKLHRTPKLQKTSEGSVVGDGLGEGSVLGDELASIFDEFVPTDVASAITTECDVVACTERTREEVWEEVMANGALILELQKKQAALFAQLRVTQKRPPSADETLTGDLVDW